MIVKALSLWEPWASLMRYQEKRIETRSWWTSYRGPLLICASKRWTREMREDIECGEYRRALAGRPVHPGMAVALVQLEKCINTFHLAPALKWHRERRELILGNYDSGRYGWITAPICLDFEPFPVRGAQGLFHVELPPELAARVREVSQ